MAYASAVALTVVEVSKDGVDITTLPTTPTGTHGNKVINDGKTWIEIYNGSGGEITVTVDYPGSVDGHAIADKQVTIANAKRYAIGPWTSRANQDDGYVWIVCSGVTSVLIGAFRLKNP